MKFLDIAIKDLYQIFKDWKPAIFLLIAPIGFTLMFGFMFGGFKGPNDGDDERRYPVKLVDQNQTMLTETILSFLDRSEVIYVESVEGQTNLDELKQEVANEEVAAAIILPAGFTQTLQEQAKVNLNIILDKNTLAGMTVQQEIESNFQRVQTAANTARLAEQLFEESEGWRNDEERVLFFNNVFAEALDAWQTPSVIAVNRQTTPEGYEEASSENAFAQSLPGMMAQFAIAGLIGASEIIVQERKSGSLDRLRSTAVDKFSILSGHWLAMFVMIFIQFFILVIFGQLFLRLNFFGAPLATLAISIASCAFVASLGLLIGILAKVPEQTIVFSLIPMFIFSGLGGAWVPLELVGETVQRVSRFSPVSWIMKGFKDILLRGADLPQVIVPVLILLGFSVLFFLPAAVIFYKKRT